MKPSLGVVGRQQAEAEAGRGKGEVEGLEEEGSEDNHGTLPLVSILFLLFLQRGGDGDRAGEAVHAEAHRVELAGQRGRGK